MTGHAPAQGRGAGLPPPSPHGPHCDLSCPCLSPAAGPPSPRRLLPPGPASLLAGLSAAARMLLRKCKLDHLAALVQNKTSRGWWEACTSLLQGLCLLRLSDFLPLLQPCGLFFSAGPCVLSRPWAFARAFTFQFKRDLLKKTPPDHHPSLRAPLPPSTPSVLEPVCVISF